MTIHLTPPPNFSPSIEAAGCFIESQGAFLLLKRSPSCPEPNTWCLPGGKLEKAETSKEAILRELREEIALCLDPKEIRFWKTFYKKGLSKNVIFHAFHTQLSTPPKIQIDPIEHTDMTWAQLDQTEHLSLISGSATILKIFSEERKALTL